MRLFQNRWHLLKEIAWNLGGEVTKCDHREYGPADITVNTFGNGSADALFKGLGDKMKASPLSDFRFLYDADQLIEGLDVPWRSAIKTTPEFSRRRLHVDSALRRRCP